MCVYLSEALHFHLKLVLDCLNFSTKVYIFLPVREQLITQSKEKKSTVPDDAFLDMLMRCQVWDHLMMCLIGINSWNGRLGRLAICVWLIPKFRKRQVWQVWKAGSTFCSNRQNVSQTWERFSISFVELLNIRQLCSRCYGNLQLYSLLPSTCYSTGNLVYMYITTLHV